MFSNNRQTHRQIFLDAWQKAQRNAPLEPLEAQLVMLIRQHPEYQQWFADSDRARDQDFVPELGQTNPFLHLGLHLTILDQLSLDQPHGIRAHYQRLLAHYGDPHRAEHAIMDCLAEALWNIQRSGSAFDDAAYFQCIQRHTHR